MAWWGRASARGEWRMVEGGGSLSRGGVVQARVVGSCKRARVSSDPPPLPPSCAEPSLTNEAYRYDGSGGGRVGARRMVARRVSLHSSLLPLSPQLMYTTYVVFNENYYRENPHVFKGPSAYAQLYEMYPDVPRHDLLNSVYEVRGGASRGGTWCSYVLVSGGGVCSRCSSYPATPPSYCVVVL